jgi:predicted patatin/cPLA2 family phospholipase
MKRIGLVLQGGGMRGIYTSGVLDFFIEQNLFPSYIVAVSAGAYNAMAYLAREKGLAKYLYTEHVHDLRCMSFRNLFRHGSFLSMDFVFDEILPRIRPFPFDAFYQAQEKLFVGATNWETGESVYFSKEDTDQFLLAVRASCSIPLLSGMVVLQGQKLLDGAIVDPIPIQKSLADGNLWNIVIRTGHEELVRQPVNLARYCQRLFPRHKSLIGALFEHHRRYNQTLELLRELRKEGRAFVLSPSRPVQVKRVERNPAKLQELYRLGYEDARAALRPLFQWVETYSQA